MAFQFPPSGLVRPLYSSDQREEDDIVIAVWETISFPGREGDLVDELSCSVGIND